MKPNPVKWHQWRVELPWSKPAHRCWAWRNNFSMLLDSHGSHNPDWSDYWISWCHFHLHYAVCISKTFAGLSWYTTSISYLICFKNSCRLGTLNQSTDNILFTCWSEYFRLWMGMWGEPMASIINVGTWKVFCWIYYFVFTFGGTSICSNETRVLTSPLPSFHCEGGKVIFFQRADVLKATRHWTTKAETGVWSRGDYKKASELNPSKYRPFWWINGAAEIHPRKKLNNTETLVGHHPRYLYIFSQKERVKTSKIR